MADRAKIKLPALSQIGVVVKDLDKTIEYYTSNFGIGPWRVVELEYVDAMVRGQKSSFKVRIAFADLGTVELELIQPISGESIYTEFLDGDREGLHHLGFLVTSEEKERIIANFAEEGIEVIQSAKTIMRPGSYAYLDTDKIGGVIFELIHRA